MSNWIRAATLGALLLVAAPATATEYTLDVSEDTAPYSFVPSLARYNNPTLYAFIALDDQQLQHAFETYLRFPDLSGVIPPGEVVDSAELLVYYAFDFAGFGETSADPGDLYCHEITGGWDQTTLTWLNRPPIAVTPVDSALGITAFGLQSFDVTPVVSAWVEGTSAEGAARITCASRSLWTAWRPAAAVSSNRSS